MQQKSAMFGLALFVQGMAQVVKFEIDALTEQAED
jgi:hypothetical protein